MEQKPLSRKEQRIADKQAKELKKNAAERKAMVKKTSAAVVIIIAVVGLVLGLVYLQNQQLTIVDLSPDPGIGPKTAKVMVDEYADFQCPACAANAPIIKSLIAEYSDQVRFEFNDFPLPQHEYAPDSAIAAQCAFDQDKFFEMHDLLFTNQKTWVASESHVVAQSTIRGYAEDLGLDMPLFDTCVTSSSIAARVDEDLKEGRKAGVNGTPTFFVNGKRVVDAPFSTTVKKAIDEALAQ